jgi:hypothetical protein
MGVGANPAAWLFGIAFCLLLIRQWIEARKEAFMKRKCTTQVKRRLNNLAFATVETTRAIAGSCAAAFVTHAINEKGALRED